MGAEACTGCHRQGGQRLREAIVVGCAGERRASLHAAVGSALDAVRPEDVAARFEQWRQAGVMERAVPLGHLAAHRAKPGREGVLHTHSPHATALACLRRELPSFHYMVAIAGGNCVPLVPYHLFGTEALSQGVGAAMAEVDACLLANHGLIAAGESLARAEKVLAEIEALCGIYLQALAVGEPALLTAAEMAAVHERFRGYGRASRAP
jgi:ribulose-5-phosphate 4-epimerase/fuculose-1-phosphate aldolase